MNTPALVTASPAGTPLTDAGVLGVTGTSVLFGGNHSLLNDSRWGGRITGGGWLDCSQQIALEADYVGFHSLNESFQASSDGSDIISRPFFNAFTSTEDAELVSFPGRLAGAVTVTASGAFQSAGGRLRWNLGCDDLGCGDLVRWHFLTGYRFSKLNESLTIREQLTSLIPGAPGTFDLHDRFRTSNEFHGGEVGMVWQVRRGRWDCELLTRLALGNVEQQVTISGENIIVDGSGQQTLSGGLLAQPTNSGSFRRNRFAVIPELGVTLGYRITQNWSANLGYSLVFWNRVVRPGDQIDRAVDERLLDDPLDPNATNPAFAFRDSKFWAQGLNLGLSYRW